jgi:hypothetical protein
MEILLDGERSAGARALRAGIDAPGHRVPGAAARAG